MDFETTTKHATRTPTKLIGSEYVNDETITDAAHILAQLRMESHLTDTDASNWLLPPKKRRRAFPDKDVDAIEQQTSVTPPLPPISLRDGTECDHAERRNNNFLQGLAVLPPSTTITIKPRQSCVIVKPPRPFRVTVKPITSRASPNTAHRRRLVADYKVDFSLLAPEYRAMFEFYAGGRGARDFVAVTARETRNELMWTRDAHRVREMENGAVVYWVQGERPHPRALAFPGKAVPVLIGFFSTGSRR